MTICQLNLFFIGCVFVKNTDGVVAVYMMYKVLSCFAAAIVGGTRLPFDDFFVIDTI